MGQPGLPWMPNRDPLHYIFTIDRSGSMSFELPWVKQAIDEFLTEVKAAPGSEDDLGSIVLFDTKATAQGPQKLSMTTLPKDLKGEGLTKFEPGLTKAKEMAMKVEAVPVIIVFTDFN